MATLVFQIEPLLARIGGGGMLEEMAGGSRTLDIFEDEMAKFKR